MDDLLVGGLELARDAADQRIASPPISSTWPSLYISDVSRCVIPRSSPRWMARMTSARSSRSFPHVPCPITGTAAAPIRAVRISRPSYRAPERRSTFGGSISVEVPE